MAMKIPEETQMVSLGERSRQHERTALIFLWFRADQHQLLLQVTLDSRFDSYNISKIE